jgi:hypothetical protein
MAVSVVFLSLAAFVLGTMLEVIIPKTGFFGKWFNPHPVISAIMSFNIHGFESRRC